MERTYLEFTDGSSHKFYEVTVEDATLTIRYGRIGDAGQSSTKTFDSSAKAQAEAQKKIAEKRKSGYTDAVRGARAKVAVPKPPRVPKLQITGFQEVSEPILEPVTKFGGQPVWLEEPCWPLEKGTTNKLPFLGQIRLSEANSDAADPTVVYIFSSGALGAPTAVVIQPGNAVLHSNRYDSIGEIVPAEFVTEAKGPALEPILDRDNAPFFGWIPKLKTGSDVALPEYDEDAEAAMDEDELEEHLERVSELVNTFCGDKIGGSPWMDTEMAPPDGIGLWTLVLQLDSENPDADPRPLALGFADSGVQAWFVSKDKRNFFYRYASQ
jgi:predicted DNA-binding WGR domain protein